MLASECRVADKNRPHPNRPYRLMKENDIKQAGKQIKINYIL